ncbi:hypothetical protein E2C01_005283 [Portunus trituberculatus]|uniref:Uncharacterized protein n=1 Tax=Portunus trituberculatus TaxID=210409 RepID=A0A5B7CS73_PORTR|nr:hypothetical protein [Portunus trituberculatus]
MLAAHLETPVSLHACLKCLLPSQLDSPSPRYQCTMPEDKVTNTTSYLQMPKDRPAAIVVPPVLNMNLPISLKSRNSSRQRGRENSNSTIPAEFFGSARGRDFSVCPVVLCSWETNFLMVAGSVTD